MQPRVTHQTAIHHVSAAAIAGICVGSLFFVIAVTAFAYKCYRKQISRNAQNRLSSAIKKGLKETNGGSVRRAGQRNQAVMKSKATSPIFPSGHVDVGIAERGIIAKGIMGGDSVDSGDIVCSVENEKDGATPEKEELLTAEEREQQMKNRKLGNLFFSTEYDAQKTALVVNILRASELPMRDPALGGCDPYIKLQLLPEKKHKCKTRVLKKTLNPIYDETFTFYGIAHNQLEAITLHFVVLSFDRYSRDEIIGEVIYPLAGSDVEQKDVTLIKDIMPRYIKFKSQGRGELLVSLCFQPAANRLTVVVLKARNLPKMDITGLSDPYVKIYLQYNGQRIAKKKTHVKKRTLNPVFNESFLFDVPYNEGLANLSLELLVLDWDRVTKNEVIGRMTVGAQCGGQMAHHWNEVMNCPRKQIAEWHKLSP